MRSRLIEAAAAALATAAILQLAFSGAGPLPALGVAFNPRSGAWASAEDARSPLAQTIHLRGLRSSVEVVLEANGVPHIQAADDLDMFRTLGYLHARYRLFQMDLLRRQGEGQLSEVVGGAALESDRLELQLGLARTAELEWRMAPPQTWAVLDAYTAGVNASISEQVSSGRLPMLFHLLGDEMLLGDLDLFFFRVTTEFDDLHAVQERRRNRQHAGGRVQSVWVDGRNADR